MSIGLSVPTGTFQSRRTSGPGSSDRQPGAARPPYPGESGLAGQAGQRWRVTMSEHPASDRNHHTSSLGGRVVGGHRRQRGQTLPLVVLFMVGLLLMGGLVIDLGNAYQQKRSAQNEADAAALAGAAAIPTGSWSTAGYLYAALNGPNTDTVSVTQSGQDTVNVSVTRTAPTFPVEPVGHRLDQGHLDRPGDDRGAGPGRRPRRAVRCEAVELQQRPGHHAVRRKPARRLRYRRPAHSRQQHRRRAARAIPTPAPPPTSATSSATSSRPARS